MAIGTHLLERFQNQPAVFEFPSLLSVLASLLQFLERNTANIEPTLSTTPSFQINLQREPKEYLRFSDRACDPILKAAKQVVAQQSKDYHRTGRIETEGKGVLSLF